MSKKHRFARFKQQAGTLPGDAGGDPLRMNHPSSEAGRSTPEQAGCEDVFTRERASELLAILDALTRQADLEPTYLLRASTLAVAIHRLALQEQTWLDQQSARAMGNSKRSVSGPTRASPNHSSPGSVGSDRQVKSRSAFDPHDSSTPIRQEKRDTIQRHVDEPDVRRQPALDRRVSPLVTNDLFDDARVSHPPWDNDQSFVTITGCDVEPDFSHHESFSEKTGFPPSRE